MLKACAVLSFRYNIVGGLNPNEQEKTYNKLALYILEQQQFDKLLLQQINPSNENFETQFTNKKFKRTSRNHKIVKYILAKIERHRYQVAINLYSDLYTVEHILPEKPEDGWQQFNDNDVENFRYRLGNLTILEKKLNLSSDNKTYEQKAALYKTSGLNITKAIAERYNIWNKENIVQRQGFLAIIAQQIWQL